jgi:hypothetical protein
MQYQLEVFYDFLDVYLHVLFVIMILSSLFLFWLSFQLLKVL